MPAKTSRHITRVGRAWISVVSKWAGDSHVLFSRQIGHSIMCEVPGIFEAESSRTGRAVFTTADFVLEGNKKHVVLVSLCSGWNKRGKHFGAWQTFWTMHHKKVWMSPNILWRFTTTVIGEEVCTGSQPHP